MGQSGGKTFQRLFSNLVLANKIQNSNWGCKKTFFFHEEEKLLIDRYIKISNILLDVDYNAKLSNFGLAIDGLEKDQTNITTHVMGTHGYAAPQYISQAI